MRRERWKKWEAELLLQYKNNRKKCTQLREIHLSPFIFMCQHWGICLKRFQILSFNFY
jgi:hypothetical protein